MSSLWVIATGTILFGGAFLVLAVRRTRDEVAPTVEAFADFRAALRPAVVALRADSAEARRRITRADTSIRTGHG